MTKITKYRGIMMLSEPRQPKGLDLIRKIIRLRREWPKFLERQFNKVDNLKAICINNHAWPTGTLDELVIGKSYDVSYIGVQKSCTRVVLKDFPYQDYFSSYFRIMENGLEIDYVNDFRYVAPYLKERTKSGRMQKFCNDRIAGMIHEIEMRFDVTIQYVALAGSRRHGYFKKDSDYDIRFIYEQKDPRTDTQSTIAYVYDEDIDALGWEKSFAEKLIQDCEPEILSCLFPKPLAQIHGMQDRLKEIHQESFDSSKLSTKFRSIAINNLELCKSRNMNSKELIHAVQATLSMIWVDQKGTYPNGSMSSFAYDVIEDRNTCRKVCDVFYNRDMQIDPIVIDFLDAKLTQQ